MYDEYKDANTYKNQNIREILCENSNSRRQNFWFQKYRNMNSCSHYFNFLMTRITESQELQHDGCIN